MMKHARKTLALTFAALLALGLAAPAAAQAAPEAAPAAGFVSVAEAVTQFGYPTAAESKSIETTDSAGGIVSPNTSWWGCDYEGKADYPHVSNNQASVHGYWVRTGGDCPSTATVTVNLQALYCSTVDGCSWITQATDAGTFSSGSGTGSWATPHATCATPALVAWRGEVDVNLTDFADPFGYHYGTAKDLSCSPA